MVTYWREFQCILIIGSRRHKEHLLEYSFSVILNLWGKKKCDFTLFIYAMGENVMTSQLHQLYPEENFIMNKQNGINKKAKGN